MRSLHSVQNGCQALDAFVGRPEPQLLRRSDAATVYTAMKKSVTVIASGRNDDQVVFKIISWTSKAERQSGSTHLRIKEHYADNDRGDGCPSLRKHLQTLGV